MEQRSDPPGPLSPESETIFSLFTTLYDDVSFSLPAPEVDTDGQDTSEFISEPSFFDAQRDIVPFALDLPPPQEEVVLNPRASSPQGHGTAQLDHNTRKRPQEDDDAQPVDAMRRAPRAEQFSYVCFSAATGEPVQIPCRSAFTKKRREEVKQVRKLGACLRCKMRKIPCSGENPCKACLSLAEARAGSRALMWMECIRPSFDTMTIFDKGSSSGRPAMFDAVMGSFLQRDDEPTIPCPFHMTLESVAKNVVDWLINGSNLSDFSVAGLLRSRALSKMLAHALGLETSDNFRLMIYLTNDISAKSTTSYQEPTASELRTFGHYAGNLVLEAVELKLRPARLEASRSKLDELRALLLVISGLSVTARQMYLDTILSGVPVNDQFKWKTEAFIRLLSHYLVYICGTLRLIEESEQQNLSRKCSFQWDKSGASVQQWIYPRTPVEAVVDLDESFDPTYISYLESLSTKTFDPDVCSARSPRDFPELYAMNSERQAVTEDRRNRNMDSISPLNNDPDSIPSLESSGQTSTLAGFEPLDYLPGHASPEPPRKSMRITRGEKTHFKIPGRSVVPEIFQVSGSKMKPSLQYELNKRYRRPQTIRRKHERYRTLSRKISSWNMTDDDAWGLTLGEGQHNMSRSFSSYPNLGDASGTEADEPEATAAMHVFHRKKALSSSESVLSVPPSRTAYQNSLDSSAKDSFPFHGPTSSRRAHYLVGREPGRFSARASDEHSPERLGRYGPPVISLAQDDARLSHGHSRQDRVRRGKPVYWTFFNQNEPFKVHSDIDRRTFTNEAVLRSESLAHTSSPNIPIAPGEITSDTAFSQTSDTGSISTEERSGRDGSYFPYWPQ